MNIGPIALVLLVGVVAVATVALVVAFAMGRRRHDWAGERVQAPAPPPATAPPATAPPAPPSTPPAADGDTAPQPPADRPRSIDDSLRFREQNRHGEPQSE